MFYKFPSTKHLAALIDVRNDKVLTESERGEFLKNKIIVEEKIDGANLGISFDHDGNLLVQNRGHYLTTKEHWQWYALGEWLNIHYEKLFEYLEDRYILFGEWCRACHTIKYTALPDWFIGFDIYDKMSNKFLSVKRRNILLTSMEIATVPCITTGVFTYNDILELLKRKSYFGNEQIEGVYLRVEDSEWLIDRAKLVRDGFVQSIVKHWSQGARNYNFIKT